MPVEKVKFKRKINTRKNKATENEEEKKARKGRLRKGELFVEGQNSELWHIEHDNERVINSLDDMKGSYLGTEFTQDEIKKELKKAGANFEIFQYKELIDKTAEFLANEKTIGWFQGRMEFGPRALGNRSIIADPRSDKMLSLIHI